MNGGGQAPHEAPITSPLALPPRLRLYACATIAAGTPCDGSRPIDSSVSATQPGLTALTRALPRNSSAAQRTNASTPAFTTLTAALPSMGCCESTPLVNVNEPPCDTCGTPQRTRLTWPISLLARLKVKSSSESAVNGANFADPAAQTTASNV